MEPTLGEEPGVPGPKADSWETGPQKMLGERAVFFWGWLERETHLRIGPTWGFLLKWW